VFRLAGVYHHHADAVADMPDGLLKRPLGVFE
jgi:hypothetical protein